MLFNIIYLIIGLAGLYYGSEWLVTGASRLALRFNVSPLIIGLTIVAIGTSFPELVVSILSAFDGRPGLALGNVIGSNIANVGLILGLTGTIRVLTVEEGLKNREIPLMIVITIFATILTLDGQLNRVDGILLLFGFIAVSGYFYYLSQHENDSPADALLDEIDLSAIDESGKVKVRRRVEVARIAIGIVVLGIGGRLMVTGASNIAVAIGVSDLVIGVTIVAFGTSLPELATSLTAVFRDEDDIAIGNIIGSNIANLLLVLGATSSVATINVGNTDLSVLEYVVMLFFALVMIPFARNKKISRIESAILLGGYVAFIGYSFFFAGEVPTL